MLSLLGLLAFAFVCFQLCLPFLLYRLFSHGPRLDRLERTLDTMNRRLDALDQARGSSLASPDSTAGAQSAATTVVPPGEPASGDQDAPQEDETGEPSPDPSTSPREPISDGAGPDGVQPQAPDSSGVPPISAAARQSGPTAPLNEVADSVGRSSLEERLGTKWAVYLGGAAIALGGIFLVRHAIEAGLLGPTTRVVLGAILGMVLVATGMRMRLRDVDVAIGAVGGAHVPSVLTAAGTVVLFASVYAAHALYGLLGPGLAFLLLGVIGLGTMASALLQGPALAGLGLAGSYITPVLITSSTPNPWPLVIFLTVVSVAALGLARLRAWRWLVYASLAGVAIWALLVNGKAESAELWRLPAMIFVLVQTAIAIFILVVAPYLNRRDEDAHIDLIATAATGVMTGLAILALALVPHEHWFHVPFAALMIALLAASAYVSMPGACSFAFASLVVGATLIVWPAADLSPAPSDYFGGLVQLIRIPDRLWAFLSFAAICSLGVTTVATYTLWWRSKLPTITAGLIALGAVLAPLLALTLAYLRVTEFGTAISFTLAGAILALCFAALAEQFDRRAVENEGTAQHIATGVFAAAAIAAIAVGLVAGLQRGYLTVAFAIAAAGTAYVADRKNIPILRYAVAGLSLIVLARVIWDPRIMGVDAGSMPILNWLLLGYGVPAVCFAAASHVLRRRHVDVTSHIADVLAILFTALLGIYQIRHFINDGDLLVDKTGHVELGLQAVLMLGLSYVLAHLVSRRRTEVLEAALTAASVIGAGIILLGLGVAYNPALTNEIVKGGVPLSTLVPAYLAPGLTALYIARHARNLTAEIYIIGAACLALALIFAYATLETRHAFHGESMHLRFGFFDSEIWAYNAVWLLLAIALLAYGLLRASLPARAFSGLLLVATTVKVGIFDLAGITGIWRALSFLCLGAVLIAIGIVYQRLVFRSHRPTSPANNAD